MDTGEQHDVGVGAGSPMHATTTVRNGKNVLIAAPGRMGQSLELTSNRHCGLAFLLNGVEKVSG